MKAADIREKSTEELQALEEDLRGQMFRLKMSHYTGQLERVSDMKVTRRDLARVLTILHERTS